MICLFVRREKIGAKTFDKMLCDNDVKRLVTPFFSVEIATFHTQQMLSLGGNFLIEIY